MCLTHRFLVTKWGTNYLERDVVVHGVELAGVDVGGSPSIISLDQVDPDTVVEEPEHGASISSTN
jgi:hypothetical protein